MSHQDPIYNQNGNCDRNQTVPVVNTSSDICVFTIPFFTMSGGSKINCSEKICSISGVSYDNILTATTECFTSNALSGSCFNSINWTTNIYEDNNLVSSNMFYTSTNINDVATEIDFSDSVITSFNTLGYDYSFSGTQYTITENGFNTLRVDIDTLLSYDDNCLVTGNTTGDTSCSCPSGYTLTIGRDSCLFSATTAATYNGSGATITAGDTNADFSTLGAYFYTNETNNESLPLYRIGSNNYLTDQSGNTINITNTSDNSNPFWDSMGSVMNGRLNNVGLSATTTEWRGFSHCLDLNVSGTYYIGIAADNYCRFSIDGELFLELNTFIDKNHKIWHVLPYDFTSGLHIIEMEGRNAGLSPTAFGAEIYYPTDFATLTGATTTGDTGLIFSTVSKIGDTFDLGDTAGYTCPPGYSLDLCGGSDCVQLNYTSSTCTYSGDCSGSTSEIICDLDFPGLTSGSTNVYPLTGQTNIDVEFTFTANTSNLNSDSIFRFEIYKYNNTIGIFEEPYRYQSSGYTWDSFSGTSAFTATIPVTNLNVDGDYLVKGYYVHDVCTEFGGLLGNKFSTSSFKTGNNYGLYQEDRDSYFVAFTSADKPLLNIGDTLLEPAGTLLTNSILLDGTELTFVLPSSSLGGSHMVALNGLTLSENYDYSLTSEEVTTIFTATSETVILKLSGETFSGDILTYVYINSTTDSAFRYDTIDIITTIASGSTNSQGSNDVYYNTTEGKYEIYTSLIPAELNNMVVTLNGVTLANNIDYYQSITNPKRIILEGVLAVGDLITIYYVTSVAFQGNITTTNINFSWGITNQPQTTNGLFTVEIASDNLFTTIVGTGTTEYIIGVTNYSLQLPTIGEVGDVLYYRIKNDKNYVNLCGSIINTTAYSEIIDIRIQTNATNSY